MTHSTDKLRERARRYIALNQVAPARAVLESLIARDPDDTAAHLSMSGLYAGEGRLRAATTHALAAARNPPEDPGLLGELIAELLKVGQFVEARHLLALPAITGSASAQVLVRTAIQRQQTGEHALALELIEKAAAAGASGRDFHFYRAVQLAFNGDLNASCNELERCIALDPPLGRAYVQLALTRKQTAESNHLTMIDAARQRVASGSDDQAALEFARHKELEDLQRHDEAWQALARGNTLMHARLAYDSLRQAALFDRLIDTCSPAFLHTGRPESGDAPQPIFVVGMARSGTTVLERMLGTHSQVISAGELADFTCALAFATDHLPRVVMDDTTLARLGGVDWGEVKRMYLAQTGWRAKGRPFFVDKLPLNWMVAGMIHKALPAAKILHLVRDPMDVCFSNWRAYFGSGPEYAYTYALDTLASHYRQYRRVMAHWHTAMPGVILDVEYSRLVREPETSMQRILAFCGLAYEPGCVDLTRNVAPSATLSAAQIRAPIHDRGFGEWRRYSRQLASLATTVTGVAPITVKDI